MAFLFLLRRIRKPYYTGFAVLFINSFLELGIADDFFRVNMFSLVPHNLHQLGNICVCIHILIPTSLIPVTCRHL